MAAAGELGRSDGGTRRMQVRCTIAMTVEFFEVWLANAFLFPLFVAVFPAARDIASAAGIATLAAVAFLALRRPSAFDEPRISLASLTGYSLSFALLMFGILYADPVILTAGAVLRAVSTRWVMLLAGVSLCGMRPRACMRCIAAAYCLSYLARIVFGGAPFAACALALLAAPYLAYAACRPAALAALDAMRKSAPQAVSSITQPSSFVPFAHALFVAILAFRAAYGFALTFGSVDGVPVQTLFSFVPLAVVLALAFLPVMPKADVLYQVAAVFVVAGFATALVLSTPAAASGGVALAAGFLYAGSECFEVLMWFALASIGARNPAGAVAVVAWGRAAASAGLLMGAGIGHLLNGSGDAGVVSWGLAATLVAFVAVNITMLKEFGFQKTIDGVVALREPEPPRDQAADGFAQACDAVAAERGLTPRETEILGLLARGRNAPYIQERLVLSRNTVKTHVANIYGKLGVHSQQDLIDIVEHAASQA